MAQKDKEELRQKINRDTEDFFKRGGKIYQCEQGETGDAFHLNFANVKFSFSLKTSSWRMRDK